MKKKTACVSLLDIGEALPFSHTIDENDLLTDDGATLRPLERFIAELEKHFREEIIGVGEDIIGEKFYYRYLFKSNGFLELMLQPPVALVAHFGEQTKAKRFSAALTKTIDATIKDKKTAEILKNVIEISAERREALSYKSWSQMRKVREG